VGVNRRTGTQWRYGRTILNGAGTAVHYPAVILVPEPDHDADAGGRYLSERERITIADLRRHRDPQGRYRPHAAHPGRRCRASPTARTTAEPG
jgi:hypothetical protein